MLSFFLPFKVIFAPFGVWLHLGVLSKTVFTGKTQQLSKESSNKVHFDL